MTVSFEDVEIYITLAKLCNFRQKGTLKKSDDIIKQEFFDCLKRKKGSAEFIN